MNTWTRLLIALAIGAAVGVGCALIGQAMNMQGSLMGGVAGALAAGIIVATLRPKSKG